MSCAMGSNPNDITRKERVDYDTSAMGSNPNDSTRKEWIMLLQVIQNFIDDLSSQFQLQDEHEKDCRLRFEDAKLDLLTLIWVSRSSPALGSRPPPTLSKLIVLTIHMYE